MIDSNWFEIEQVRPHLYCIQERLDLIEPRFRTTNTNMYLIEGTHSAILFDTGIGIGNIRQLVENLIQDKDLMIINSHNHFDHVGGNHLFDQTHVHRLDFKKLVGNMDLSFLKGGNEEYHQHFVSMDWKMKFAGDMIPLIGNEIIHLGDLEVELIYTPGHTPGSICLLTDNNELFTGDTIHYGSIYLPGKDQFQYLDESLHELHNRMINIDNLKIFPGHEKFDIDISIFGKYFKEIQILQDKPDEVDRFLQAKIFETEHFTFIQPFELPDPDKSG